MATVELESDYMILVEFAEYYTMQVQPEIDKELITDTSNENYRDNYEFIITEEQDGDTDSTATGVQFSKNTLDNIIYNLHKDNLLKITHDDTTITKINVDFVFNTGDILQKSYNVASGINQTYVHLSSINFEDGRTFKNLISIQIYVNDQVYSGKEFEVELLNTKSYPTTSVKTFATVNNSVTLVNNFQYNENISNIGYYYYNIKLESSTNYNVENNFVIYDRFITLYSLHVQTQIKTENDLDSTYSGINFEYINYDNTSENQTWKVGQLIDTDGDGYPDAFAGIPNMTTSNLTSDYINIYDINVLDLPEDVFVEIFKVDIDDIPSNNYIEFINISSANNLVIKTPTGDIEIDGTNNIISNNIITIGGTEYGMLYDSNFDKNFDSIISNSSLGKAHDIATTSLVFTELDTNNDGTKDSADVYGIGYVEQGLGNPVPDSILIDKDNDHTIDSLILYSDLELISAKLVETITDEKGTTGILLDYDNNKILDSVDINGDNIPDGVLFDKNGDGSYDLYIKEFVQLDSNIKNFGTFNYIKDTVNYTGTLLDTDYDLIIDSVDLNNDGIADSKLYDLNFDGIYDHFLKESYDVTTAMIIYSYNSYYYEVASNERVYVNPNDPLFDADNLTLDGQELTVYGGTLRDTNGDFIFDSVSALDSLGYNNILLDLNYDGTYDCYISSYNVKDENTINMYRQFYSAGYINLEGLQAALEGMKNPTTEDQTEGNVTEEQTQQGDSQTQVQEN